MDCNDISMVRRLHSESTDWVSFYALRFLQSCRRGFWLVALKMKWMDGQALQAHGMCPVIALSVVAGRHGHCLTGLHEALLRARGGYGRG